MINERLLAEEILTELSTVTMSFQKDQNTIISEFKPFDANYIADTLDKNINDIALMNYYRSDIRGGAVTGLEAIVEALAYRIKEHFHKNFKLDDLADVDVINPQNGVIYGLQYYNGMFTTVATSGGSGGVIITSAIGSGTLNYVTKFINTSGSIGDSQIYDDGTRVSVGTSANTFSRMLVKVEDSTGVGVALTNNDSGGNPDVEIGMWGANKDEGYIKLGTSAALYASHDSYLMSRFAVGTSEGNLSKVNIHDEDWNETAIQFTNGATGYDDTESGMVIGVDYEGGGFIRYNGYGDFDIFTSRVSGYEEPVLRFQNFYRNTILGFTSGNVYLNGTTYLDILTSASSSKILVVDNNNKICSATTSAIGIQPLDPTLTALAELNTTTGFIYQTGIDTFTKYGFGGTGTATTVSRSDHNHSGTYEPTISSGLSAQYWRGDKTWQVLNTGAVAESTNLYFTTARVASYLTGAISDILTSNLTANRVLLSDSSGKVSTSSITATELGYLSGVTSAIQTQLNDKLSGSGTTGRIPYFTGAQILANSSIYTNGINVAIGKSSVEAWGGYARALQIGGNTAIMAMVNEEGQNNSWLLNNCYYDGTWKPYASGDAARFVLGTSGFEWTFNSGLTADTQFTLTRIMTLSTGGVLNLPSLTANRAVVTDGSKNVVSSAVTSTELGYLSGVTSAIQTQLNGKLSGSGTTGRIPYFTAGSALGNSNLYFGGKSIRLMAAPSSWGSAFAAIEVGLNALWTNYTVQNGFGLTMSNNTYHDGTGQKPYVNGLALSYSQDLGEHIWTSDQGLVAGTIFTPTERMRLDFNGLFLQSLNASRAVVTNSSGYLISSSVTTTELGYLSGVSSAIQTQLNDKVALYGLGIAGRMPYFYSGTQLASSNLYINASRHIGFDKVPAAWGSAYGSIDIGLNAIWGNTNIVDGFPLYISNNRYNDGTNNIPYVSGSSLTFRLYNRTFGWYINTSLTAGVAFSPTQVMQLGISGLQISTLAASSVVFNNSSGYLESSSVTPTELGYLSGKNSVIDGSGTIGYIPMFSGANRLTNSAMYTSGITTSTNGRHQILYDCPDTQYNNTNLELICSYASGSKPSIGFHRSGQDAMTLLYAGGRTLQVRDVSNATLDTILTTGNFANRTSWPSGNSIDYVVGQLAWKNYDVGHTIFDASQSTSPNGTAVNNSNSEVAWIPTYPTLMGWNGSETYGVRVDSARIADVADTLDGYHASSFQPVLSLSQDALPVSTGGSSLINSNIYSNGLTMFIDPGSAGSFAQGLRIGKSTTDYSLIALGAAGWSGTTTGQWSWYRDTAASSYLLHWDYAGTDMMRLTNTGDFWVKTSGGDGIDFWGSQGYVNTISSTTNSNSQLQLQASGSSMRLQDQLILMAANVYIYESLSIGEDLWINTAGGDGISFFGDNAYYNHIKAMGSDNSSLFLESNAAYIWLTSVNQADPYPIQMSRSVEIYENLKVDGNYMSNVNVQGAVFQKGIYAEKYNSTAAIANCTTSGVRSIVTVGGMWNASPSNNSFPSIGHTSDVIGVGWSGKSGFYQITLSTSVKISAGANPTSNVIILLVRSRSGVADEIILQTSSITLDQVYYFSVSGVSIRELLLNDEIKVYAQCNNDNNVLTFPTISIAFNYVGRAYADNF